MIDKTEEQNTYFVLFKELFIFDFDFYRTKY